MASGIVSSVASPIDTVKGLVALASRPDITGRLLRDALVNRYGSIDAVLKTAYTDPVGMASDLSLTAGAASKAAQAAGFARSAHALSQAATALNPLSIPAQAAQQAGRGIYRAAINPSRRIRRGFPGALDEGFARNVLPTQGGLQQAEVAATRSSRHTKALLRQAEAAGAQPVMPNQIAPAFRQPIRIARTRVQLGKPDERPALVARARALVKANKAGTPLTQANVLKQEAQTLADSAFRAQERGALIKDLDAMADLKVAQHYRRAIEQNAATVGVTEIAQSNRRTQSLIGLAQALEDATQQPSRLTHLMATLGGVGGALAAGPGGGVGAYVAGRLATAKPAMAGSGLLLGKVGAGTLRHAQIARALAVIRALDEREQPPAQEQDERVNGQ